MATVVMTRHVKRSILGNIGELFDARKKALLKRIQDEGAQIAKARYDELVSPVYAQLEDPVIKPYIFKIINFTVLIGDHKLGSMVFSYTDREGMPAQRTWHHENTKLPPGELYDRGMELLNAKLALDEEEENLVNETSKTLDSVPNLARLLEVWPGALEFCPESVQRAHQAPKPTRIKRGPAEISSDMKTGLLKARLMTGES